MQKILVLRLGHRLFRDKRITTHVGLVARAFGANGMILSDVKDDTIKNAINKINGNWGGKFFIKMGVPHIDFLEDWIKKGNIIVHLTMYGENLDNSLIDMIKTSNKDMLLVVGSQKVPRIIYDLATYNISISNQPHSEVAALAIFLDRYFEGKQLSNCFEGAKFKIIPSKKDKIVQNL